MASPNAKFPVTAAIAQKLQTVFQPSHLEVINESYMHKVPKDSETHFKVVVVSEEFEKVKAPIQRHRLVNAALAEHLEGPVHALSIVAKTPAQWQKMLDAGETVESSPACRGGDGSLPSR
jgi:BolA-like protein 1